MKKMFAKPEAGKQIWRCNNSSPCVTTKDIPSLLTFLVQTQPSPMPTLALDQKSVGSAWTPELARKFESRCWQPWSQGPQNEPGAYFCHSL